MAATPVIDATLCPLCQQANQCAMEISKAQGLQPTACWCASRKIDAALLARISPQSRGLACICKSCACGFIPETPSTHAKDNHANVPH